MSRPQTVWHPLSRLVAGNWHIPCDPLGGGLEDTQAHVPMTLPCKSLPFADCAMSFPATDQSGGPCRQPSAWRCCWGPLTQASAPLSLSLTFKGDLCGKVTGRARGNRLSTSSVIGSALESGSGLANETTRLLPAGAWTPGLKQTKMSSFSFLFFP